MTLISLTKLAMFSVAMGSAAVGTQWLGEGDGATTGAANPSNAVVLQCANIANPANITSPVPTGAATDVPGTPSSVCQFAIPANLQAASWESLAQGSLH